MRNVRTRLDNERGVALVLALMMLLALTGLLLAFMSVSALEPQISKNVADTARARYLAEAGIELGFNVLASTGDLTQSFTPAVTGATGTPVAWAVVVNNGTISGATTGGSAAEATFAGTYNVLVRNDYLAGDQTITGVSPAGETATADTNKIVIMRSTGTFNGATKTIEVVVRRAQLPPFPGAVNLPGVQTDTLLNKDSFEIDGRDYGCTSSCDNAANWSVNSSNPNKYGIATQTGTQANIGTTYEANIENASNNSTKQGSIKGRDETRTGSCPGANCGPTSYTTGLNTIQAVDPASVDGLGPQKLADYLAAVSRYAGTTILQSTPACRLVLTGTGTPTSTPTLSGLTSGGSACGTDKTLNLGSPADPKLVYFRADLEDPSSRFIGLETRSGIKGAGVLIIEDGDLNQLGNLTWDGVVIVTGRYVGAGFRSGSSTTIRGAFVANETMAGEAGGFFEFLMDSGTTNFSVRSSKQNIDLVQLSRGNTTITNWREM